MTKKDALKFSKRDTLLFECNSEAVFIDSPLLAKLSL